MKIRNVLKVIGLGASLATVTTACGTKDGAVSTVAEMPETVVSTENETVAETETETQEIADELTLEEVRAELEGYKDRIKEAGYDYKSVGFETKYFDLRKGGAEPEQALTMTIEYFDAENASMGELETETETETQTGEVYVSNGISEAGNTGSDATGEELTDAEKAAVEQAEIEAQKQAEAQRQAEEAAKAQAEAQRQAEAQKAAEAQQGQQTQQNFRNADGTHNYDAMRQAGYSEEQVQWQMQVDANADKSNPNYGKTLDDIPHRSFSDI